jgi:hypothetical protein
MERKLGWKILPSSFTKVLSSLPRMFNIQIYERSDYTVTIPRFPECCFDFIEYETHYYLTYIVIIYDNDIINNLYIKKVNKILQIVKQSHVSNSVIYRCLKQTYSLVNKHQKIISFTTSW